MQLRPLVATTAAIAAVLASAVTGSPAAASPASPAAAASTAAGSSVRSSSEAARAPAAASASTLSAGALAGMSTFIVMLGPDSLPGQVARLAAALTGGSVEHVYTAALQGFAISLPSVLSPLLSTLVGVTGIEPDQVVTVATAQSAPPNWGLDRIDQRPSRLNETYNYPRSGAGVDAYIIDTGIRLSHEDFAGRAVSGVDFVDGGLATDCNGHGTHVAGILGGRTFGVAKAVRLISVRVLGCDGSGANSDVIAGIDWVTEHHQHGRQPAVANLSLTGGDSRALDLAVGRSLLDGISYAVAAGNESTRFDPGLLGLFPSGGPVNACNSSPARVPAALTVGATDRADNRAVFSNIGGCLDLFAPGTAIRSTWFTSDAATAVLSGTSMSAPLVAGAAALYLQKVPDATPNEVSARLKFVATEGTVDNAGPGSPNRLLYFSTGV